MHTKSPVRTCRPGLFCRYNWDRLLFSRKTFKDLICILLSLRMRRRPHSPLATRTPSVGPCFVATRLEVFADLQHGRSHRSEEHTSELQSLMRISYAVFFLKKKK